MSSQTSAVHVEAVVSCLDDASMKIYIRGAILPNGGLRFSAFLWRLAFVCSVTVWYDRP
uniref:Uncharacterized protein n=1 Tax=Heterorhabditis bacteriophora TaxID=37862 RepID=A0A1I7WAH2_HETBA